MNSIISVAAYFLEYGVYGVHVLASCFFKFMHGHFGTHLAIRNCRSFGCFLLLNLIYLTAMYRSTISLRFIWSIRSGKYGLT